MQAAARARLLTVLISALGVAACGVSDPPHVQAVESYYATFHASSRKPAPLAYPELEEVARQLFEPEAVSLGLRVVEREGTQKRIVEQGKVWYSKGALFVRVERSESEPTLRNYATLGDRLIEWEPGAKAARSYARYPGDTVDFLWYLIDPSAVMKSIYFDFLRSPRKFRQLSGEDGVELSYSEPMQGLKGISIARRPLWFRALTVGRPERPETIVEIDRPVAVPELPAELSTLPEGLAVEPSLQTIRSRMLFLPGAQDLENPEPIALRSLAHRRN